MGSVYYRQVTISVIKKKKNLCAYYVQLRVYAFSQQKKKEYTLRISLNL